ncbi:MAG: hypothetical protein AB9915_01575 [Candidatus Dojkabacteria bacterium]
MEEKDINTIEYIKMVKESPQKKKSYIFLGFTILVSVVLIIFAIRPTIIVITRINREIKEKTALTKTLASKIKTLTVLEGQYAENKKELNNLELIFPADGNFSLLMSNIDSVVSRNGFALSSLNFDDYKGDTYETSTTVLQPKILRIGVKGKEINLINLLRDLEALPMYSVIESMAYSTQKDNGGFVSFSISLRVYDIENDKFYK